MIATLQGTVTSKGDSFFVVETGGIGFKVHVPGPLLSSWGTPGRQVQLLTYLHVRENEMSLYGFRTQEALSLFQMLLGVSGIGPKRHPYSHLAHTPAYCERENSVQTHRG